MNPSRIISDDPRNGTCEEASPHISVANNYLDVRNGKPMGNQLVLFLAKSYLLAPARTHGTSDKNSAVGTPFWKSTAHHSQQSAVPCSELRQGNA